MTAEARPRPARHAGSRTRWQRLHSKTPSLHHGAPIIGTSTSFGQTLSLNPSLVAITYGPAGLECTGSNLSRSTLNVTAGDLALQQRNRLRRADSKTRRQRPLFQKDGRRPHGRSSCILAWVHQHARLVRAVRSRPDRCVCFYASRDCTSCSSGYCREIVSYKRGQDSTGATALDWS